MYDENALYDEFMGIFKQTGQKAKSAVDIVQYINRLTGGNGNTAIASIAPGQQPVQSSANEAFEFTGQSTDLRYFADHREMPISMIENIPDETLKNAVKEEFNKAAAAGRIDISAQTGRITITDSGREYISRPGFRSAAARDVAERAQSAAQTMGFIYDIGYLTDENRLTFDKCDLKLMLCSSAEWDISKTSNFIKYGDTAYVHSIVFLFPRVTQTKFIKYNKAFIKSGLTAYRLHNSPDWTDPVSGNADVYDHLTKNYMINETAP